ILLPCRYFLFVIFQVSFCLTPQRLRRFAGSLRRECSGLCSLRLHSPEHSLRLAKVARRGDSLRREPAKVARRGDSLRLAKVARRGEWFHFGTQNGCT